MYSHDNLKIHSNRPRQYIIDLDMNKTVEGRINGVRNVLVRNYWVLMLSVLGHTCLEARRADGALFNFCGYGDVNYGSATIQIGTGVAPESFANYHLATPGPAVPTSIAFGTGADRNRISASGVAPSDFTEFIFIQEAGAGYWCTYGRKVISGASGQAINYSIDYFEPWTYTTAQMLYGVFANTNVTGVSDIGGTVFTLRTTGDFNESPTRLVISETAETWTPTKISITNPIELETHLAALSTDRIVYLILTGVIAPATSITARTVGIVQKLYGTDGIARNCLMLLQPLATPITLEANKTNMIQLRLIAL